MFDKIGNASFSVQAVKGKTATEIKALFQNVPDWVVSEIIEKYGKKSKSKTSQK
jgi:hypothetical protein